MSGVEVWWMRGRDHDPAARGLEGIVALHGALRGCTRCPAMQGPPVHGASVISPVMLIGQAPGT